MSEIYAQAHRAGVGIARRFSSEGPASGAPSAVTIAHESAPQTADDPR